MYIKDFVGLGPLERDRNS